MADSNQFNLSDHDYATKELSNSLISKIEYLKVLNDAIDEQDDRLVY
ncbi:exonuclease SbcC, partial [Lactobacillus salivarius]|nr:exonuclease SbcC [Ligilactobacillus salivarius]